MELDLISRYPQHTLKPKWICLTSLNRGSGIRGYLLISISVCPPGDTSPPPIPYSELINSGNDLNDDILLPPQMEIQTVNAHFNFFRGIGLPQTDRFGKIDPYIRVDYNGVELKTRVISKNYCPIWDQSLIMPVNIPTLADQVTVALFDANDLADDEKVASFTISLAELHSRGVSPRWKNLYRLPSSDSFIDFISGGEASHLSNCATEWCGLILWGGSTSPFEPTTSIPDPQPLVKAIDPPDLPPLITWTIRVNVHSIFGLTTENENLEVQIRWGVVSFKPFTVNVSNNVCSILRLCEEHEVNFPPDIKSLPDIIVSIYRGNAFNKSRLCFVRIPPHKKDIGQPIFYPMESDPKASAYDPEQQPGFICLEADLLKGAGNQLPVRQGISSFGEKCTGVLFDVLFAEKIPSINDNGVVDPCISIHVADQVFKTVVKHDTTGPMYFERLSGDALLPVDESIMPPLVVKLWDSKTFLGQAVVPFLDFINRSKNQPIWLNFEYGVKKVFSGRVLMRGEIGVSSASTIPLEVEKLHIALKLAMINDIHDNVGKCSLFIDFPKFRENGTLETICNFNFGPFETYKKHVLLTEIIPFFKMYLPVVRSFIPPIMITLKDSEGNVVAQTMLDLEDYLPENKKEQFVLEAKKIVDPLLLEEEQAKQKNPFFIYHETPDRNFTTFPTRVLTTRALTEDEQLEKQAETVPQTIDDIEGIEDPILNCEIEELLNDMPYTSIKLVKGQCRANMGLFSRLFSSSRVSHDFATLHYAIEVFSDDDLNKIDFPKLTQIIKDDWSDRKRNVRIYIKNIEEMRQLREGDKYFFVFSNGFQVLNSETLHRSSTFTKDDRELYLTFTFDIQLPETQLLAISVFKEDMFGDSLLGSTLIDVLHRDCSKEWKNIEIKPLQRRGLFSPEFEQVQGYLSCIFEMLTEEENESTPLRRFEIPEPIEVELRGVIWNTKDVIRVKDSENTDIFVRAFVDGSTGVLSKGEVQDTDIHWRSEDGTGAFNWRFKFNFKLPAKMPRLKLQIWDQALIESNDCIAEANISLYRLFDKMLLKGQDSIDVKKQWISLRHPNTGTKEQGKIEVELSIVRKEYADDHPVGLGREEPNRCPVLNEPNRPDSSFPPYRIDKAIKYNFLKHKWTYIAVGLLIIFIVWKLLGFIVDLMIPF
eukprot:TRINITY_DN3192_c0_g6_i1.p1 TRINITY_DN3192_c0_g6~~TRINITY_DN3192_c0_g6_i1.p1  ORF type:complete len:1301 (+),score=392.31 TRINITY_DN3192_c0_g6_i1:429-3905(+)